jgi:hypothetical protein
MEKWKDVIGYEGLYQVSDLGRVKSICRDNLIMKQKVEKDGYFRISLTKEGIKKSYRVHRLVIGSFVANPKNKPQVNHINGIKTDNCLDNLEWATASENMLHADRTGLRKIPKGEKCHMFGKFNGLHQNAKLVLNTETGIYYDCAKEAAKFHKYKYSTLKSYLNGTIFNKTPLVYV